MTSSAAVPALVHDYLLVMRGAERTFEAIAGCFPTGVISTLLYDPAGTQHRFADRDVRTSSLQRWSGGQARFRRLLPLLPHAAERLPVQDHELVVSSSSAFAHGVRTHADGIHVCYCHSPFRYAWHERARALEEVRPVLRPALGRTLAGIRRWDVAAAHRVTHYIANSAVCRQRIRDFWGREAAVVHPPVETGRFAIGVPEDFFLVVAELVRHKRIDVALEAARRAGQRVKVVGTGPDLRRLSARYGDTAEFVGRISDAALADLYPRARAQIVPNVEEFGIAAVEAQAAGRPVLGADAGGTRETVVAGETGVLVPPGDVGALTEAMRYTNFERFSPDRIKRHADRFSTPVFQRRMIEEVARVASPVRAPASLGPAAPRPGA